MAVLRNIPYYLVRFVCWTILRIGYDLQVIGQENVPKRGAFIVASNHVSHLDPVVIGVACPRRVCFLARESLWEHPLMWIFMTAMQCIPIKRGQSDFSALREAARRLKSGERIGLFPEGTRQPSGQLGTAKRGIGLLAAMARVSVVPAVVVGTYEALPKGAKGLQHSKIRVAFGPVIPYTDENSSTAESGGRPSHEPGEARTGKAERRVKSNQHDQLAEAVTRQWQRLSAHIRK